MPRRKLDRVIFEFVPVGSYVKVSAVDPVSYVEVSIVGDPQRTESDLRRTALKKLQYVLDRKEAEKRKAGGRKRGFDQIA